MRLLVVGLGSVILAAATTAVSVASVAREGNPALALTATPWDAASSEGMADALLAQSTAGSAEQSRAAIDQLAKQALARSPLSPGAMRVLALLAAGSGDKALARRRFQFAGQLSRRDLATRLWLIQDAVDRDDALGALDQFDMAMRTSMAARPILYPILAGALSDPEYVAPVATVLARQPNWGTEFVISAIQSGKATANIALLLGQYRGPSAAVERQLAEILTGQLVSEKRFDMLARYLDSANAARVGVCPAACRLASAGFDSGGLAPFAWNIASEQNVRGDVRDGLLDIHAGADGQGTAASRLLLLTSGRYMLAAAGTLRAVEQVQAGARWTMSCVESGTVLATLPLGQPASVAFAVPATGCRAQILRLDVKVDARDALSEAAVEGSARSPTVRRIGGA